MQKDLSRRYRLTRRELLALGMAAAGVTVCIPGWPAGGKSVSLRSARSLSSVGALKGPDENGLLLPEGFRSRVVARSRVAPVAKKPFSWHDAPDGGAVFAMPRSGRENEGGWMYVSNCEVHGGAGGAGALQFDAHAQLVDAYSILSGTTLNCAGGPTPWGTWLSCEEHPAGLVWECDPTGRTPARPCPALGAFTHEAVTVDPHLGHLYLTEDVPDGRWYRFTPANFTPASRPLRGRLDLDNGMLEAAELTADGLVHWHRIADPSGATQPTRYQAAKSTPFRGGEGCWYARDRVFFTTKVDWRVWAYDPAARRMAVLYDGRARMHPVLTGVDNVTVSEAGDILIAEDAGDMQIVALNADGLATPIVQVAGHSRSEIAGPAFDPSGTRLYFSSQRGASGRNSDGVTYEVTGPFSG